MQSKLPIALSLLACLLAAAALFRSYQSAPKAVPEASQHAGLRQEIKGILSEVLSEQNRKSPSVSLADLDLSDQESYVREAIKEAVAREVRQRVENDLIQSSDLENELLIEISEERKNGEIQKKPVDLSPYHSTEDKLDALLSVFVGSTTFMHESPVMKQLHALGPEAKEMMMEKLRHAGGGGWGVKAALKLSLEKRLTEEDRDFIIESFKVDGAFAKKVGEYRIHEVEDELIAGLHNRREFMTDEAMEAALLLNTDRAIEALKMAMQNGETRALTKLHTVPEVSFTTHEIEEALKHCNSHWEKQQVLPVALEYGSRNALLSAAQLLSDPAVQDYSKKQVLESVRRHTGAIGSAEDVGFWIIENRDRFSWNDEAQYFEMME